MTGKGKIVDLVLGVLIFASLAFIGYRLFDSGSNSEPGANTGTPASKDSDPVVVGGTSGLDAAAARPAHPQWLLVKVKPIQSAKFKSVIAASAASMKAVEKTSGCSIGFQPTTTVSVIDRVVANRVEAGELQFLFGFKQPRCYVVGGKLQALYYSSSDREPFVTALGTVTISDLVEFQPSMISPELLSLMGVTKEEYVDFSGFQRPAGLGDMLVRFDSLSKSDVADGETPMGFPRAEVVGSSQIDGLKKRFPNLVVVDVRANQEFKLGSIAGAKNVPFKLPAGMPTEFSWKVLNKDIAQSKFEVASVSDKGPVPVVVVGASSKDPRPMYAMSDLLRFGYRQVYWLRDGVSK
ncbi:MAG: rhodanese-like domain-containing protein [Bdellovibrionales bacterium]|jgi:rhodanese-related sulfurtransferase|nr:rhodanese-like domain-containing protein [Bdellovibrionales bacterium]